MVTPLLTVIDVLVIARIIIGAVVQGLPALQVYSQEY